MFPELTQRLTHLGLVCLATFVFVLSSISAVMLAQWLEHKLFPVVTEFQIFQKRIDAEGGMTMNGIMYKQRDCEFIQLSVYAGDKRQAVQFLDTTDPVTRSVGLQLWGPWRMVPSADGPIHMHSIHRCHPLWLTFTDIIKDPR